MKNIEINITTFSFLFFVSFLQLFAEEGQI